MVQPCTGFLRLNRIGQRGVDLLAFTSLVLIFANMFLLFRHQSLQPGFAERRGPRTT